MTRVKLRALYDNYQELPFPHNSAGNESLSRIIDDLADLDMMIAGCVSSYLHGGKLNWNLVALDWRLDSALSKAVPNSENEAKALKIIKAYKKKLDELTLALLEFKPRTIDYVKEKGNKKIEKDY